MSLTKQIFLYSVATDAFYNEQEQYIHKRLLSLYGLRKKIQAQVKADSKYSWRRASVNRVIAKEKAKLSALLDKRLEDPTSRELNPEAIKDKNVISLFESSLTRALGLKTNELTKTLMVLNVFFFQVFEGLVKNGFMYEGERYIFLTASAGQIRTKRAVFVKESAYLEVQNKLMCGLTIDHINEMGGANPNKFLAYLALNNSATDVWEEFDIDKSIVVDDFETDVIGLVDYIDDVTYDITRKEMPCNVPHMDGCGLMLHGKTRMVRMPWMKGLLVQFPFDQFIKERCGGQAKVCDIYGHEHDVVAEGIEYIFTASQFKMAKYYNSWEEYKDYFKKYGCEACYCNIEEDYIPNARINYQMLQTLSDITDDEIGKLMKRSLDEIDSIGNDYQTTMRLLGATEYNQNPNFYQQALMQYPELFRDQYSKEILKQTKKSLVKQAKAGRLRVNGKYFFLSPDLYAFCEWLFLGDQNPKGLLADGEVYCSEYRDGDELACLRSPHLYREWPIRVNKKNEELDRWFGKTKCIYTSCHDLISRILQFDVDGDKALVVRDRTLTRVAKRNMEGIVPLYYEMKKAKGSLITNESLYEGMVKAFTTGNIGPYSNNITKIWNCGKEISDEQLNVVRWLCAENNYCIDCAKTLYMPTRPKYVDDIIKSYTKAKLPYFFQYAKDKELWQVEPLNTSPMNRLCASVPTPKIKFNKNLGKFDYKMLLSNKTFEMTNDTYVVLAAYDYWNKRQSMVFNTADEAHSNQEDMYVFKQIRANIIEATGYDVDFIVDSLVSYLYTMRTVSTKKLLWSCFGGEIVANLKKNVVGLGNICPICGARFAPNVANQVTCSSECGKKMNVLKQRMRDKIS